MLGFYQQRKGELKMETRKMVAPPLGQSWNAELGWHDDDSGKIIYLDEKGRIQFEKETKVS
jgi:hypothetical protein